MSDLQLPVHWQFAAGRAFAELRDLVCSFDFLRLANEQTYSGIKPSYLIEVIDGFLGEFDALSFGGERTTLQQLWQLLVNDIQPTYARGLIAGRECWKAGDQIYGFLEPDELHRLALSLAPADDWLKGWFAEGFCLAYACEEMESLGEASG